MILQDISLFLVWPCRSWHTVFLLSITQQTRHKFCSNLPHVLNAWQKCISMCCMKGIECYQHHYLYAIWSLWISCWTAPPPFGNLTQQWVTWTSRIRSFATFEMWICFRDSLYHYIHYIPEDGTLMPKHVGVWYVQGILFYDLYFIMFHWVHLLVVIVNVRICMAWIT